MLRLFEPARVGSNINYGNGRRGLEPCDQFQAETLLPPRVGYKDVAPDVFSVEKPVSSYAAKVEPRLLGSFAQRRR